MTYSFTLRHLRSASLPRRRVERDGKIKQANGRLVIWGCDPWSRSAVTATGIGDVDGIGDGENRRRERSRRRPRFTAIQQWGPPPHQPQNKKWNLRPDR